MLKKLLNTSCVIALALLCTSCASLKCKHFPGEQMPITEDELSEDSIWKFEDHIYHVKVVSSNNVVASSVKWDDEAEKHTLESLKVVVSKLDEIMFLNLYHDELYTILRLVPTGDEGVVIFTIDPDKVEDDIEKGKVKGSTENHNLILECSQSELDAYVRANINTLFSLEAAGMIELIEGEMD